MIPKYIITSPNKIFTEMVYEATKETSFNDFILVEGAFEEAVEQVLSLIKKNNISVIVSRAITAKMIQEKTDIPVLDAKATLFDILTSISQAMKISKNIALIHHEKIVNENFLQITDLFNINLKEYIYNDIHEFESCIYDAYNDGNEVIVNGYSNIKEYTEKLNIPAVMYSTSSYTMKEILSRASLIRYAEEWQLRHENQLRTFINEMPDGVIYLNEHT